MKRVCEIVLIIVLLVGVTGIFVHGYQQNQEWLDEKYGCSFCGEPWCLPCGHSNFSSVEFVSRWEHDDCPKRILTLSAVCYECNGNDPKYGGKQLIWNHECIIHKGSRNGVCISCGFKF